MANNTPPGFEDPALIQELIDFEIEDTEDRYLIDELPHYQHLDTEDKNFEQE